MANSGLSCIVVKGYQGVTRLGLTGHVSKAYAVETSVVIVRQE